MVVGTRRSVVVGLDRSDAGRAAALGSVSHGVLHHATSPVLVVRHES
ncbi:MAG TPA: universal stress protein [Actinomycetes bacterium]|nr:universal stress protein [Actinomycetes bacterium]